MQLSEVTFIIPTRNRPQLLRRQLASLCRQNPRLDIIVADGSDKREASLVQQLTCSEYPRVHLKQYQPSMNLFTRLATVVSEVNSNFVQLVADDDFIVVDAVREAASMIDKGDFISATGKGAGIHVGLKHTITTSVYRQSANLSDGVLERLDHFSRTGHSVYYHLYRREFILWKLEIASKLNLTTRHDFFLQEMLDKLINAIAGKTLMINRLYLARVMHAEAITVSQPIDWFKFMTSEDVWRKFDVGCSLIAAEFGAFDQEAVIRSISSYLARAFFSSISRAAHKSGDDYAPVRRRIEDIERYGLMRYLAFRWSRFSTSSDVSFPVYAETSGRDVIQLRRFIAEARKSKC